MTNCKACASVCEASSYVPCEGERVPSWLIARCYLMSADYQKGREKIVLERKKESMRSAWIGQLVAESLGGDIDLQKEIDLRLRHFFLNCTYFYMPIIILHTIIYSYLIQTIFTQLYGFKNSYLILMI